ncbi:hypothetical protein [Paenibacillus terrae]|uniref:hypothetical protein n=1 Tax=Paenibacillus terrae TaxID=159743 RepID=UPI001656880F|nr:hypothetical protein [Paenibacillus terrae]
MDRTLAQQCYYQQIVQHQRQNDVSVGIGTMRSVAWYRGCLKQERGTGERSNTSDPGRCERSFLHAHDDPSFEPAIVQVPRWDRFYKGMKH